MNTLKTYLCALLCVGLMAGQAQAHGFKLGALHIDHPYATPSENDTGHVFFRRLTNEGAQADRLVEASTPVAQRVVLQRKNPHEETASISPVAHIELPPHGKVPFRHDSPEGYVLALQGLSSPLKVGDRFTVTLRFAHAGTRQVEVWVQQPRPNTSSHSH